jgi:agarase
VFGLAASVGARPDRSSPPPGLPRLPATGFFRLQNLDGVWWFIDPAGSPTLSIGVDDVAYEGDRIGGVGPSPYLDAVTTRYGTRERWAERALERLRAWGFNTLGAWSDHELWTHDAPHVVMLDIAANAGASWISARPADVFAPRFEAAAREIAAQVAAAHADDRSLIGYFSDNELWWGNDWRRGEPLLAAYLAFPPGSPGRERALDMLRARYGGSIARLNRAWRTHAANFAHVPAQANTAAYRADAAAFLELAADRYFAVCARAIRSADPHHLYLGARFMGLPPDPVIRAAAVADAVSLNLYDRDPRRAVRHVYALTGRPVLVTEFSFRALDSGLPNTVGAGPWVFNERTRGWAYISYVARLMSLPEAVGYHWFRWADEPRQGRSDGENSNYGLVTLRDAPYADFLDAVTATNHAAADIHRGVPSSLQTEFLWRHWDLQDIPDTLLGGPRWLATAFWTIQGWLARGTVAARAPAAGR